MAIKLDDATWHIEDADKQHPELDPEDDAQTSARFAYAGAHIALFFRWGAQHGFGPGITSVNVLSLETGEKRSVSYEEDAQLVTTGKSSATEFMESVFDWKLYSDAFVDRVRAFAEAYYGSWRGLYPWDVNSDYSWIEQDCDFDDYSRLIDRRFAEYHKHGPRAVRRPNVFQRLIGLSGPQPANWRPN